MTLREERLTQRITLREYCLLHNLDIVQRSREERAEYSADDIVDKLPAICSSMSDADAQSMIKMLEARGRSAEDTRRKGKGVGRWHELVKHKHNTTDNSR